MTEIVTPHHRRTKQEGCKLPATTQAAKVVQCSKSVFLTVEKITRQCACPKISRCTNVLEKKRRSNKAALADIQKVDACFHKKKCDFTRVNIQF
jgi:hypothetical protein